MKINSYTKTGTKTQVVLPKLFTEKVNKALLDQAIHVYRDRSHQGTSKVQSRNEVSLVKQKWYRQKGTGNARHGAKSAPIFVGGGVAHGPKGVKRILSLPKKMRQKALLSALSFKSGKGHVALADLAKFEKTKDVNKLIGSIKKGEEVKKAKLTFVFAEGSIDSKKAFFNLENVNLVDYRNLNAYKAYFGGRLVFDKAIFDKTK